MGAWRRTAEDEHEETAILDSVRGRLDAVRAELLHPF